LDPIATRKIEELMLELKTRYTIAIVRTISNKPREWPTTPASCTWTPLKAGARVSGGVRRLPADIQDPKEKHTQDYIRGEFS
jgi:phosphate transport system ATP-binding protein